MAYIPFYVPDWIPGRGGSGGLLWFRPGILLRGGRKAGSLGTYLVLIMANQYRLLVSRAISHWLEVNASVPVPM